MVSTAKLPGRDVKRSGPGAVAGVAAADADGCPAVEAGPGAESAAAAPGGPAAAGGAAADPGEPTAPAPAGPAAASHGARRTAAASLPRLRRSLVAVIADLLRAGAWDVSGADDQDDEAAGKDRRPRVRLRRGRRRARSEIGRRQV